MFFFLYVSKKTVELNHLLLMESNFSMLTLSRGRLLVIKDTRKINYLVESKNVQIIPAIIITTCLSVPWQDFSIRLMCLIFFLSSVGFFNFSFYFKIIYECHSNCSILPSIDIWSQRYCKTTQSSTYMPKCGFWT